MENYNMYISEYKELLQKGVIPKVYSYLMKYVMNLKAHLEKGLLNKYSFGNVSPGYMDFTYFPFLNEYLRDRKLRFGIVLNHEKVRFELWLMGRNTEVQKDYWERLKTSKWNKNQPTMPKYSVLEVVLIENPDFDDLEVLNQEIEKESCQLSEEIIDYLKILD